MSERPRCGCAPPCRATRHRSFDVMEIFLADVQGGKTDRAVRRALELGRAPAYVIAQDANDAIPDKLHDGTPTGVVRCRSLYDVRAGIAKQGRGIFAVAEEELTPVIELARDVSARQLAAHGGRAGVPTVIYVDEATTAPECKPGGLGPELRKLIAQRRHFHVGLLLCSQGARFCHWSLLARANVVHVSRFEARPDLRRLEEGGIPDSVIARVPLVARYQFIRYERGADADG